MTANNIIQFPNDTPFKAAARWASTKQIEETAEQFRHALLYITFSNNTAEIADAKAKLGEAVAAAKKAYEASITNEFSKGYYTDEEE